MIFWQKKNFTDISDKSEEIKNAINALGKAGIISGTSKTEFSPDKPITRAEIAALLLRMTAKTEENGNGGFSDVSEDKWYYNTAGAIKKYGIVEGFDDNTFRGDETVSKVQLVSLAARVLRNEKNMEIKEDANSLHEISDWAKEDEILVLLKNGYADAAYARHRTLYELSIVADFLVKYGDDVAKAYIEYDGQWYDWANKAIPKKGRIHFSDIEKNCSVKDEYIALWNKEYKLSNKLVHASPQGTFSRLAIRGEMKAIPIDSSVEGMVVPAVNSIESLYHVNCMYFGWEKDSFALVFATVLNGLKQKVFEKFDELETDCLEKFNKNTSI